MKEIMISLSLSLGIRKTQVLKCNQSNLFKHLPHSSTHTHTQTDFKHNLHQSLMER
ncbi:hypothetical protein OAV88_02870 [bacterium]|nr:hypothetical protein [bacterium]